ncbi:hypothetical protein CMI37_26235 [Candidatus Pacearchaeota archaeon]|nr:hypothetical protein [Candidatus Pacearchaeota archaeon]|tara:strand:- start:1131 stop:1403 length:273 start_codon:yes stop_codon:yes gene_type:complete
MADDYIYGLAIFASVQIPFYVFSLARSALTGLKARHAFKMISLGDNPRTYRWDIDDARIDPIARLIVGGKRLDARSRATEEGIDREMLRR